MKARIMAACAVLAGMVNLTGCGTMVNMCLPKGENKTPPMQVYGGVQADHNFFAPSDLEVVLETHGNSSMKFMRNVLTPFVMLDVPLSFVGDTVTLPVTFSVGLYEGLTHLDDPPPELQSPEGEEFWRIETEIEQFWRNETPPPLSPSPSDETKLNDEANPAPALASPSADR
jgi:uncharacterized protein YceK